MTSSRRADRRADRGLEQGGTQGLNVACSQELHFTAEEWRAMPEEEKERTLHNYRLAFRADTMVNWCPKLGTVLANDEVHDGLSVRGGHPVEQKRMKQWLLRVTATPSACSTGWTGSPGATP